MRIENGGIKEILHTILDHNNNLLKHNESLHQSPFLSK